MNEPAEPLLECQGDKVQRLRPFVKIPKQLHPVVQATHQEQEAFVVQRVPFMAGKMSCVGHVLKFDL
ncbi:hypothetical protein D3C72_2551350 [compost metagenome]